MGSAKERYDETLEGWDSSLALLLTKDQLFEVKEDRRWSNFAEMGVRTSSGTGVTLCSVFTLRYPRFEGRCCIVRSDMLHQRVRCRYKGKISKTHSSADTYLQMRKCSFQREKELCPPPCGRCTSYQ